MRNFSLKALANGPFLDTISQIADDKSLSRIHSIVTMRNTINVKILISSKFEQIKASYPSKIWLSLKNLLNMTTLENIEWKSSQI